MKEDKKKILTAAAFLIAAGLMFGMTRSRSGIQKLDESGAVVMSGSLDADGNISWEKNGSAKSDGLPQGDSGSSTEKQELQEPFRDENGSVQGESTVETQEYVENSEKSGVYVYICGEVINPGVYELFGGQPDLRGSGCRRGIYGERGEGECKSRLKSF